MIVASVDTHTGDAVLLGLPRSLVKAQMPEGPARERFPDGYTGDGGPGNELLNAVWEYGENHPDVVPDSDRPGPDLLKGAIGATLGIKVDYYVLINMFGFKEIVDAFGGVKINITKPVPYGKENEKRIVNPEKVLRPGTKRLDGSKALWYVRSRSNSSEGGVHPIPEDRHRHQEGDLHRPAVGPAAAPGDVGVEGEERQDQQRDLQSTVDQALGS
jgi:LCP family protein required for cell wall assembly